MERLTSPNINVDPGTDRFLHAAIGGQEIDWKQSRDSTLNVLINGRCFSRTSFINSPAVEPDDFCCWGATE